MTVLVYDDFVGANGTDIADHTPDIDAEGGGWQQDAIDEVELDGSGAVKFASVGDSAWINAGTVDQIVKSNINAGGADNRFQLVARSDSAAGTGGTNYSFNVQPGRVGSGDNVTVFKRISGGSVVSLASDEVTLDGSTTYELEFSVIGSDLVAKIDGVEVLSVTDTSITTGDYAGFYHALYTDGALRVYDFQVEDDSGIETTLSESGPSFTESISATISASITATISESGPSFTESISAEVSSLTISASISEQGPSFTESVEVDIQASTVLAASITELGPSFSESIEASILKTIESEITEQGPSFTESITVTIPVTVAGNYKYITRVKNTHSSVRIRNNTNIKRVK